jgi:hypothetical protein
MPEVLNAEEFANFQAHLIAQRDQVTEGGVKEPSDELVRILSMQHAISNLSTDIHMAAGFLGLDPVILSETARMWDMHLPLASVQRGDF